jgi:hypothetical protein
MADKITVSLTIDDRKVTLEGPREFVQAEVRRLTDLLASGSPHAKGPGGSGSVGEKRTSEREFVAEKNPEGHSEHLAVLAFYMTFIADAGKSEFTEDEMRRAYIRAGVKPPKVVGQAIRDAKKHYDFFEPSGKRGSYKISPHGESFVRFDLPRKE